MKSIISTPTRFAVRCLGHFMPALCLAVITLVSCRKTPTYYVAGTSYTNYTIHTDVHCERISKRARVAFTTPQILHDCHSENLPCCPFCMSSDDAEALHEAISLIRQAEERRDKSCPIEPYTNRRLYLAYRGNHPTSVLSFNVRDYGWEGIAYNASEGEHIPFAPKKLKILYAAVQQAGYKKDYATFVSRMSGNDNYHNRKYIYSRFREGGADVGSTYEEFMARMCNDPHYKSRTLIAMLTAKGKRIRVPLSEVSARISHGAKLILTGNPRPKYLLSIPSSNYEDTVQTYTYYVADVQNVNQQGWSNYASSHPTATVRMMTPDRQHRDIPLSEAHSAILNGMKAVILYQEDRKSK